ncbi:MAG TPA: MarR family winged helix-turn-helix transcriptional regulator [Dehalococcoidia bacterium]
MDRPVRAPIGLHIAQVAKAINRAFDDALADAGASLPVWLVLIALKSGAVASQRQLAAAVGIEAATLSYHLGGMESDGYITRRRDPENRRVHLVQLTPEGDALFLRLRATAAAFDKRLRAGVPDADVDRLAGLLSALRDNVSADRPDPAARRAVIL